MSDFSTDISDSAVLQELKDRFWRAEAAEVAEKLGIAPTDAFLARLIVEMQDQQEVSE